MAGEVAASVFALPMVTPSLYRIWARSSDGSGPVQPRPGHTPGRRTGYPPVTLSGKKAHKVEPMRTVVVGELTPRATLIPYLD